MFQGQSIKRAGLGDFLIGAFSGSANGTIVKFTPKPGSDTRVIDGTPITTVTQYQCITAMEEYESKSLEELRLEDYTIYRKAKQDFKVQTLNISASRNTGFNFGVQNKPQFPCGFTIGAAAPFGRSKTRSRRILKAKRRMLLRRPFTRETRPQGFQFGVFGNKLPQQAKDHPSQAGNGNLNIQKGSTDPFNEGNDDIAGLLKKSLHL